MARPGQTLRRLLRLLHPRAQGEGPGSTPWHVPAPLLVVGYFVVAICFFGVQEGWTPTDSFYFAVMVLTTIGYGDMAPATSLGKFVTCLFALSAVALIMSTVEELISLASDHRLVQTIKKRLFGDLEVLGDLDDDSKLVRKKARLRMFGWMCLALLFTACLVGRHVLKLADWCDCLYFAVVTITTVGFGDIAPKEPLERLCVAVLTIMIVPLFATFLGSYVDLHRGSDVAEADLTSQLTTQRATTLAAFKQETRDAGKKGSREDFLVFMLVRNGVVTEADVQMIWDDFAAFDADGDGLLDSSDLQMQLLRGFT
mmetsp:Transcript_4280/g.8536  ORF Transcript_4280/g.8536 Transcript_4280/m.8536 type:complete len:313 (-) Transcript_4280:102-1040(-)